MYRRQKSNCHISVINFEKIWKPEENSPASKTSLSSTASWGAAWGTETASLDVSRFKPCPPSCERVRLCYLEFSFRKADALIININISILWQTVLEYSQTSFASESPLEFGAVGWKTSILVGENIKTHLRYKSKS